MADTDALSEDDLALINALQIHPRARWTELSPILEAHPTTLATRWARLRELGYAWVTGHRVPTRGCLAFVDVECDLGRLDHVIRDVCAMPDVASADVSARNRDLMLTVSTEDLPALTDRVLTALPTIQGVRRFQTSVCTRMHLGGDAWRLQVLDRSRVARVEALKPPAAATDQATHSVHPVVAQVLAEDGRATAADIARRAGMHPTTAQRHLARVEREHSLSFRCEVAQRAAGFPVHVLWYARVPPGTHEEAAAALVSFPELRLCASITGSSNFIVTMWLRSVDDIMTAEHRMIQAVPTLEFIECSIGLNIVKRVGWGLNPDGTAQRPVPQPS